MQNELKKLLKYLKIQNIKFIKLSKDSKIDFYHDFFKSIAEIYYPLARKIEEIIKSEEKKVKYYQLYEENSGLYLTDPIYSKKEILERYQELKEKYERLFGKKTFNENYNIQIKIIKEDFYSYKEFLEDDYEEN